MTNKKVITLDKNELLTFVRRCFEWRNADVFAFGRRDSISRLGEIAGYISMYADAEGKSRADSVKVILPPPGDRDVQCMRDELREGVRRAYRRFDKDDERIASFVDDTYNSLHIIQSRDLTTDGLSELFSEAKDREAVIVGEASLYWSQDVAGAHAGPKLAEDLWCAHLHRLMLIAEEAARATGSYVILDIGEYLPSREANLELLMSAGNVGICGGSYESQISPEELIEQVGAAYNASSAGNIGKALSSIKMNNHLSDRQKWFLRLVMLSRAGIQDQVSETLDVSGNTISDLKGDAILGVAQIAADADRDDFAQMLIDRALPDLMSAPDLENALRISASTRRQALIAKVREKLRQLHPRSELLRAVDARDAAREGDYARAADLLAACSDEDERSKAEMFRLLAKAVASPEFSDPIALTRDLTERMQGRATSIQLEIILSLERAGRRDEAVAVIFAGFVKWNEEWFVFARGLVERALVSGSRVVSKEVLSNLIDVAAAHIAEHPADGYARTSVADLLDADHVGVRGVALLLLKALQRSDTLPTVRDVAAPERTRLKDIGKLPSILKKVLIWLATQGDGIIVSGRHAIPAEVLGENPDAVLTGLLRMVDQHAPDVNDPADEQMMKQFVTVAHAVAPIANDPDGDLSVLRGAAVQLNIGGRPQIARDLAEQALIVAGDRPTRRRKALTTFADIYARVGRVREALLALIAAFELPSEGSWHEAWQEQSLLLRLVRDVGVPDQAILIIERLRKAMGTVANTDEYGSRLDTLELHAQVLKRQIGDKDAWPIDCLLKAATANAAAVLAIGDEALPGAMLLRQLIDGAEASGIEVSTASHEALKRLTARLAPPHRLLITAAARLPDLSDVAAIAGPIQAARYNDDTSYDFRLARTMGRRLARSSTEMPAPEAFAYAVELLSVQGMRVRSASAELAAASRILADKTAPLAAAVDVARRGLPVVGMALDDRGLMTMTVTADGPGDPVAVPTETFDPARLIKWSESFPYGYSDPKLEETGFRDATTGLGLPDLPLRALLISGDLTRIPPNVLTVDNGLAGNTRALATAPSLAWLQASMGANRRGDGSAAAWIPIAADSDSMATLSLLRDDIADVLEDATVPLYTQSGVPAALMSADLAIVGAHGGLAERNRYFRSLSDDRHEPADLQQLADALRRSRLAILFVCSGGRLDLHPESGGLVGIAHRLLDRGLDAVVAPSWPIPFSVARPWLKAFLKSWTSGEQVIDACRAGNAAVDRATSYDLTRSLAMTLHGNPFITSP